jgi:trk system potassium uptake protein
MSGPRDGASSAEASDAPSGVVARRLEQRLARAPRRPPGQLVALGFLTLIGLGSLLLWTPMARSGPGSANLMDALFTATSATCVVGLTVVDTGTHWSHFGQVVILVLIQVGGLGIMAGASLIGIAVSRRLGLRTRVMAAAETRTVDLSDVRRVVLGVTTISLTIEAVVAVLLTLRFALGYDEPWKSAAWDGVFHAVSSFNNAGFSLFASGLTPFVSDPWVCLPIDAAVILGGLGFPVLFEVFRDRTRWRRRGFSPNTRSALGMTAGLLVLGTVAVFVTERANPLTLGPLNPGTRLLASFTQSVMPRSAGFNTLDYSAMTASTLLITMALMFIGGSSASTAGGIKVGTAAIAASSVWGQLRGDDDTVLARRTVPDAVVRQAYALIFVYGATVFVGILAVLALSDAGSGDAAFEVTSALTTTGLSTGVTGALPAPALLVLTVLMYVGRLGPVSLGAALALRNNQRRFRYPEGRPNVG